MAKEFLSLVEWKDYRGTHPAGHKVEMPYDKNPEKMEVATLIEYGVLAELPSGHRRSKRSRDARTQTDR